MVISGLGSGGVRRSKAIAQPARTFMHGRTAARQHSGKCGQAAAAHSLDVAQKGDRLNPRCPVGGGGGGSARQNPERIALAKAGR